MRKRMVSLMTLLAGSLCADATDWPHWRGPNHNGISGETDWQAAWPAAGPKRLWKVSVGTGFASVAVHDGRLFTLGNSDNTDTVFCLNPATGETLWTFAYSQKLAPKYYEGGPSASPSVDGNRVYTFSKSGIVHCLDVANGKRIWKRDLAADLDLKKPTWGFAGSPLVEGNRVILNAGHAGVALDKETGEVLWSSGEGPSGYSSPVPFMSDGQACVALMGREALLAVRAEDGEVLWKFPWKTRHDVNAADPVRIGDDRFFITSGYGHGCALVRIRDGQAEKVWENKNMRSQFASAVLWQGHLYGLDDKELVCLDVESGETLWSDRSVGKGSLIIAGGILVVLGERGELYTAEPSPSEFKIISSAQILGGKCWTSPVLANGRIFCRNAAGDLVGLAVGST